MSHPREQHRTSDFGLRPSFGLRISAFGLLVLALALVLQPNSLRACAACAGQSDSAMAQGMNWGIFSLLGVIVTVLGGVAAFFVYLARRSAALAAGPATAPLLASAGVAWRSRRSAPVLGRSDFSKHASKGTSQSVGRVGHFCARGRAHPESFILGGSARKPGPESAHPTL